jgi:cytochrome c oxidase subunit 2
MLAPPLDGLYGSVVTLADGSEVTAGDQYIRDAILDPNVQVVAGYRPVMPTYRGAIGEEEAIKLAAYIRTLNNVPRGAR